METWQSTSSLDETGKEIFEQTPVSLGIHFERPTPLHIRIKQQILQMMAEQSAESEDETFADADDFECEDDPVPYSPYEFEDDFDHLGEIPGAGAEPQNKPQAQPANQTDSTQSEDESWTTDSD